MKAPTGNESVFGPDAITRRGFLRAGGGLVLCSLLPSGAGSGDAEAEAAGSGHQSPGALRGQPTMSTAAFKTILR